ncbi:MAG: hypothetical protein L6R36_003429 [Xanthoria steineri]|nr:MAG: hypothetical protein L6R36_003429 [Xanthoria steineri]
MDGALAEANPKASVDELAVYATPPPSPTRQIQITRLLPEASVLGRTSGMEGDEQQRRQYEQQQQFSRSFAPGFRPNLPDANPSDRFRQAQMMAGRSPTAAGVGSPTEAHTQELGNFGYPQGLPYPPTQMQGSSMQFPTDYSQDSPRSQPFPQYASQMVYNVPQQNQPRSPYDTMPQYQPRQSAALEVLSSQFGVPQYYHPNEPAGGSEQASTPQQYAPSQFNQPISYPALGTGRNTIQSPYPVDMAEYPQSTAAEVAGQQEQETLNVAEGYREYPENLKATLESIGQGRLTEAGGSLLDMSERLLGHVKELGTRVRKYLSRLPADLTSGLTSDNESLRNERLEIWRVFNTCWLAVLQRQREVTQQILDTGQRPRRPQNVLRQDDLERMAESLMEHCDYLERYGLVDYQMGVWEEEIMSILGQCLDVLEAANTPPEGGDVGPRMQGA